MTADDDIVTAIDATKGVGREPCRGPDHCCVEAPCDPCYRALDAREELYEPLAEVVRRTALRPWWNLESNHSLHVCDGCGANHVRKHARRCRYADIDAALDEVRLAVEWGGYGR